MSTNAAGADFSTLPQRNRWVAAALQMTSTADVARNLDIATKMVRKAAQNGADLAALPENVGYLHDRGAAHGETLDGEILTTFRNEARSLGIHVLVGSFPERIPRMRRVHNTSVLIGRDGDIEAIYRKMHLFDVRLPAGRTGSGRVELTESDRVKAGTGPVVAATELGRLGLSICYDLRFPELYRHLALRGAEALLVPSAFTDVTGRAHWMALLRARAIENLAWVIAPAQVGTHHSGRASFGHACIVDPWGRVVAVKERGQGMAIAEIELEAGRRLRQALPCLEHVREDLLPRSKS